MARIASRRTAVLLLIVAGIAAAGAGAWLWRTLAGGRPASDVPVLALSFPDADGRPQPLSRYAGKVVVLNFWATWCAPCREEIPDFVRLQSELGGRGLQFVGIAADSPEKVQAFAAEFGVNYPLLIGGYGAIELSRSLGNRIGALPFTVIVDRDGRVAHVQLGVLKPAQLRSISAQLL
jgi:peroxiredoxin